MVEYIKRAGDSFTKIQKEREQMKEIKISRKIQAQLIGQMIVEQEFIESTQLNIIRKELEAPTFDYGVPNSLWELYQYTTFAMKEVHPSLWMNNHIKAHSFFVNEAGILVTPGFVPELPIVNQLELFVE